MQGPRIGALDKVIDGMRRDNIEILKKLFRTVYHIAKEEKPFAYFPTLVALQIENGSDLRRLNSYVNDQACRRLALN